MENIYVLCVALYFKADSVCFRVPDHSTCEQTSHEWIARANTWAEKSHYHGQRPVCACMTYKFFADMNKPLFTLGDRDQNLKSVESEK